MARGCLDRDGRDQPTGESKTLPEKGGPASYHTLSRRLSLSWNLAQSDSQRPSFCISEMDIPRAKPIDETNRENPNWDP
ncbi:hypothetical protein PCANC_13858 [Puccinia coronata f. sp. avenae]|uniref:Uncharacterized protein n=1 Tax=Puccinia coronata f. sp. avenae TaxID=200324 RepID=A0A2N5UT38_9BASI|nr:hypothetical protein PCANC_13858 [Puccinia coronata f. sp. avenae]